MRFKYRCFIIYRLGDFETDYFMSDDAPAFFKAWASVFNVSKTQKLLCQWHVKKNWINNVKNFKDSDRAITDLMNLLNEPRKDEFFNKWRNLEYYIDHIWCHPRVTKYLSKDYKDIFI